MRGGRKHVCPFCRRARCKVNGSDACLRAADKTAPAPDVPWHGPKTLRAGTTAWWVANVNALAAEFEVRAREDEVDSRRAGDVRRERYLQGSAAALAHAGKMLRALLAGQTKVEALRQAGLDAGRWAKAQHKKAVRRG